MSRLWQTRCCKGNCSARLSLSLSACRWRSNVYVAKWRAMHAGIVHCSAAHTRKDTVRWLTSSKCRYIRTTLHATNSRRQSSRVFVASNRLTHRLVILFLSVYITCMVVSISTFHWHVYTYSNSRRRVMRHSNTVWRYSQLSSAFFCIACVAACTCIDVMPRVHNTDDNLGLMRFCTVDVDVFDVIVRCACQCCYITIGTFYCG